MLFRSTHPDVLRSYARHYQTDAPIPEDLIAKIEKAGTFNQGFATVEYLTASILDMDWHTLAVLAARRHPVDELRELLLDFVDGVRAERAASMQAIAERAKQHTPNRVKG